MPPRSPTGLGRSLGGIFSPVVGQAEAVRGSLWQHCADIAAVIGSDIDV